MGHPAAVVDLVARIVKQRKSPRLTLNPIAPYRLEPLVVRRLVEVVDRCNDRKERQSDRAKTSRDKGNEPEDEDRGGIVGLDGCGDLAEHPGGEAGDHEEDAVGDPGVAAADAADSRPTRLARRAAGCQE